MKNNSRITKLSTPDPVSLSKESQAELHTQWMMQVKAGDQEAFEKIFQHYQGAVVSYANQWVRNQDQAEEIAQEAFLKIYRARDSYVPTASFVSWLWTIVRNTALDFLRKKKEFLLDPVSSEDSADSGTNLMDLIEDPLSNAEIQLIEETDRKQIENCMAKITTVQRDALQLRLISELSYDEIAKTLNTSVSAIKSLLNRAKMALIQCFERNQK